MALQFLQNLPLSRQLRRRIQSLPEPKAEESIELRILVQALVIVGIIATDVAANTQMSFWAVPLSIVGAIWSWHRRRDRNVETKFILAIAMIATLFIFFANLVGSLNDTRLVLAELLIQLQVLHSFDLPRRRDLGYSMVIGLILLGVAGTLSQTIAFGPFLLVFVAIALPSLVFDYRSRLGIEAPRERRDRFKKETVSSLRPALYLLPIVVILGLVVFALMPRIPGYQLQTLPVSGTIDFQGNFEGRNIVNPGGGTIDEDGEGLGVGSAPGEGPGEVDDTLYSGFSTRMNQNLRGLMEPQIVMRVRSQAEGFWRVLAFDRYTGQGWDISRNDEAEENILRRSSWTFRFWVPAPATQSRIRPVIQTYTISSDFPNLIPVLPQAKILYFPTREIAIGPEGGLRSPVPLSEGLTYSVISQVPYRDRTVLGKAPTDYTDDIREHYLQIPEAIAPQVREFTESVLAEAENPLTNPYEISLYLAQYLKQNYRLPTDPFDLPYLEPGEDLVENFLFRCQGQDPTQCIPGGYPDHYSSVLTIMLRSVGIPARLVTGFAPGDFNPFTGLYVVRNTDAYAMTEVYFPGHGWFAFDPIPGHDIVPPTINDYETFGVLRQFWNWVAGWLPSPVAGFLSGLLGAIGRIFETLFRLFASGWQGVLLGLLVLLSAAFAVWLGWQSWRNWQHRRWLDRLPPAERTYQQMLELLSRREFPKHPAQTPLEYARAARSRYSEAIAEAIASICHAYGSWRYGGKDPDIEALRQQLERLQTHTEKEKSRR